MSCDYCCGGKSMMPSSCSNVGVAKADGVYLIYYEDGYRVGVTNPIRFCPMCGERFPGVVHDSLESIKQDMTLEICEYAKKRGINNGVNAGDEQTTCKHCEWLNINGTCDWLMRNDLADRLGKLINEETER